MQKPFVIPEFKGYREGGSNKMSLAVSNNIKRIENSLKNKM